MWTEANAVYLLCLLASTCCAALLIRTWRRSRLNLLLWSACAFALLAVNNLLLVVDLIVLPQIDLSLLRQASLLVAVSVLITGFIWEAE